MEDNILVTKPTFDGGIQAKIKQLGEIESNIKEVKDFATKLKKYYSQLIFDDENIKVAKEEKAKVNKFKDEVANYRKNIIKQWKEPIVQFETMAKETEKILVETYDAINEQCNNFDNFKKIEKQTTLREFFDEYCKSYEIDFIDFEDIRIKYYTIC